MSKFFINRPIVAMVISIVMVIVGTITILSLPVAQFPNIAPPEIQIQATYVGADAQTLEQSVATPIEQQMSGVDNMNYMYSLNATANGGMTMIVDFDVKTDPNTDQILAQMRETQAASQLPADVTNYGITVQKSVNPAGQVGGEPVPKGQEYTYSVRAQGRLVSADDFGQIVVRETPDGGIVRVKDVARVELGSQDYTVVGRLNGKPGAIIAIYQLPG